MKKDNEVLFFLKGLFLGTDIRTPGDLTIKHATCKGKSVYN